MSQPGDCRNYNCVVCNEGCHHKLCENDCPCHPFPKETRYTVDPFNCDCGTEINTNKPIKKRDYLECPNKECLQMWVITV